MESEQKVRLEINLATEYDLAEEGFRIVPTGVALSTSADRFPFTNAFDVHNQAVEVAEGVKEYLIQCVEQSGANRVTFHGSDDDMAVLNLWFGDELYPFMNNLGVRRTYFENAGRKPVINVGDSGLDLILDTEFNAAVGNFEIDPISIALVNADEESGLLYCVSSEFNEAAAAEHPFLPRAVLPKLPETSHRLPNEMILQRMKDYLKEEVERTDAKRVTFWAKNGGMGDFLLMKLWFKGEIENYMQELGVETIEFNDTQALYQDMGRPDLRLERIDPAIAHAADADALDERKFFRACRGYCLQHILQNTQQP